MAFVLSDLHVGFVEAVRRAAHLQVRAHPLVNLGRVALYPPEAGDVVDAQPALAHHLLQVAVGELVPAIPSDAQKNERGLEVSPLERGLVMLPKSMIPGG